MLVTKLLLISTFFQVLQFLLINKFIFKGIRELTAYRQFGCYSLPQKTMAQTRS